MLPLPTQTKEISRDCARTPQLHVYQLGRTRVRSRSPRLRSCDDEYGQSEFYGLRCGSQNESASRKYLWTFNGQTQEFVRGRVVLSARRDEKSK